MGRPPSDLDDYWDWQERLESYRASGLEVDVFCLQEGVSRSTFYRWMNRLKDGILKSMAEEEAARERAESGQSRPHPRPPGSSPCPPEIRPRPPARYPHDPWMGQSLAGKPNPRHSVQLPT